MDRNELGVLSQGVTRETPTQIGALSQATDALVISRKRKPSSSLFLEEVAWFTGPHFNMMPSTLWEFPKYRRKKEREEGDGMRKRLKKTGTYRFVEQFGDKEESSRKPIAPWAEQPGGALSQRAVEPRSPAPGG